MAEKKESPIEGGDADIRSPQIDLEKIPTVTSSTNTSSEAGTSDRSFPSTPALDEEVDITSELFKDALKRLNETVKKENIAALKKIQEMTLSEDQIVVGIGVHVVKKLTGRAETTVKRSNMKCPCGCKGTLDYTPEMFIGSEDTWHGELDMMSYGTGIAASTKIDDEGDGAEEETMEGNTEEQDEGSALNPGLRRRSSNGRTVNIEFKKKISDKSEDEQQVIAQSIVFGWTQVNRHPEKSPFIPTVFIDSMKFTFIIYNPESDGLLLSDCSVLFIDNRFEALADKFSGIFVLWLVLHHRIFFKRQISYEIPPCGFKSEMKEQLEFYKSLHDYRKNVKVNTECPQWGTCLAVIDYPKKGVKRSCPNWD